MYMLLANLFCRYCSYVAMFHSSTQKKHWLFREGGDLEQLRKAANQAYCEKVGVACRGQSLSQNYIQVIKN